MVISPIKILEQLQPHFHLDENIGKLIMYLKYKNLYDNTYLFSSDNELHTLAAHGEFLIVQDF